MQEKLYPKILAYYLESDYTKLVNVDIVNTPTILSIKAPNGVGIGAAVDGKSEKISTSELEKILKESKDKTILKCFNETDMNNQIRKYTLKYLSQEADELSTHIKGHRGIPIDPMDYHRVIIKIVEK